MEIAKDTWITWTGGKPSKSWTRLEEPFPKSVEPNQCRSTSISTQSKSQYYRTKGLETKFTKKSDLQTFQKDAKDHLEDNGLDTISYLPDPSDKNKLVSVITDHARFNLKDGVTEANEITIKTVDVVNKQHVFLYTSHYYMYTEPTNMFCSVSVM